MKGVSFMIISKEKAAELIERSVQINNGLAETSGDGSALAFDTKYGIMFHAYMPGNRGNYGESRGKIALSYFPASQPTNIRFREVICEKDVYAPNILSLGDGKVRVLYEKFSRDEGDHAVGMKDYDFITDTLSEEKIMKLKMPDGQIVPYNRTNQKKCLEAFGGKEYEFKQTEQNIVCGSSFFRGDDGLVYGAACSYLSDVLLIRSCDNLETAEPFALFPYAVQYEFDFRFLNGAIHALYRTNRDTDCQFSTVSYDMGKTWTEPVAMKGSIQCRPRVLVHQNRILRFYNVFNDDTKNRPAIQQGRTALRISLGEKENGNENEIVAELYSKYGIVNIAPVDILGDVYLGFSTSELALEYHNGNPMVRGKDAVRYMKLGDLTERKQNI